MHLVLDHYTNQQTNKNKKGVMQFTGNKISVEAGVAVPSWNRRANYIGVVAQNISASCESAPTAALLDLQLAVAELPGQYPY